MQSVCPVRTAFARSKRAAGPGGAPGEGGRSSRTAVGADEFKGGRLAGDVAPEGRAASENPSAAQSVVHGITITTLTVQRGGASRAAGTDAPGLCVAGCVRRPIAWRSTLRFHWSATHVALAGEILSVVVTDADVHDRVFRRRRRRVP